jgi:hypothetical protein
MRYRRGELAGIKKCRQGCLKKQKGEDESNRVWGARLYIANFEYRDFHLIGNIFGGQSPPLSPFLQVEREKK